MGVLGSLAKIGGAAGGFMLGGPAGAMAGYGLGSAIAGGGKTPKTSVDPLLTHAATTAGGNATADRNRYLDLLSGGQGALNTSIQSAVSSAMPGFTKNLEGVRESAVRRGMSTGDLGTSYEGDLASAFQRNIANAAGSQAMNLYHSQLGAAGSLYNTDTNNYLSLLRGNQDYATAQQNAQRQRQAGLFGGLGAAVGGYFGGATGAQIGGALGAGIGGY